MSYYNNIRAAMEREIRNRCNNTIVALPGEVDEIISGATNEILVNSDELIHTCVKIIMDNPRNRERNEMKKSLLKSKRKRITNNNPDNVHY